MPKSLGETLEAKPRYVVQKMAQSWGQTVSYISYVWNGMRFVTWGKPIHWLCIYWNVKLEGNRLCWLVRERRRAMASVWWPSQGVCGNSGWVVAESNWILESARIQELLHDTAGVHGFESQRYADSFQLPFKGFGFWFCFQRWVSNDWLICLHQYPCNWVFILLNSYW